MTSIMRRTVRGAAAGLGALAVVAGAAACGGLTGGDDEKVDGDDTAVEEEQPAAGEDASEEKVAEEGEEAADEGQDAVESEQDSSGEDEEEDGAAAGGEVSDADLDASKQQVLAFFEALGEKDGEAACGFVLDPTTGEPAAGAALTACADTMDSSGMMDMFTPEMVAVITEDALEASDNGDGTIKISAQGADFDMHKADDGKWYIAQ